MPDNDDPMTGEYSDRGRYVTGYVSMWIVNDGDHIKAARAAARDGGAAGLRVCLSSILRTAAPFAAAWHTAQELAANDYDRIDWHDVTRELTTD